MENNHFTTFAVNMPAPSSASRILIVTQDFPPVTGGIQSFIFELAAHFHKRGHTVRVLCPGAPGTPSPLPPEVEVTRVNIHSSWLFLPLLFRLPGLLRRGGYDVVLFAQWQSSLPQLLVPRAARRYLSLCPAYGRELLTSVLIPFHRLLCRAAFRNVDVAVPISTPVEAMLRRIGRPRGRVALIHPGVDPMRFRPGSSGGLRDRYGVGGAPLILAISRLVRRKGHDLLIRALSRVLESLPDARLLLGGRGPEEQALRALALELGVERAVIFAGRIADDEMVEHYRMADLFALPSRQGPRDVEGFGIVCLEAGGCEVPSVATNTGGIADAVVDGETGLLVPQEDVPALADALLRLLRNPEEAKAMGRRARARILEGLTWEATGDKYLALMNARNAA
jgi:phosphatidylinositol alpha-1,6-mannosyltransferase